MAIQTRLEDMSIGDKIISKYVASSGVVGAFSELGTSIATPIPATSSSAPNGSFHWIYVADDFKGRKILVAEKNIQHSISWDSLNTAGYSAKDGVQKEVGADPALWKTNIRLLTGGTSSATTASSEWDKYIVNSTLGGSIVAGDNDVWNLNKASYTSTTISTNSASRVIRGNGSATAWGDISTNNTASSLGFRPVLVAESLTLPNSPKLFLIEEGAEVKKHDGSSWVVVGSAPATEEMFISNGMTDLSLIPTEAWNQLGGMFSILEYIDQVENMASGLKVEYQDKRSVVRTAKVRAIPNPKLLLPIGDIGVGGIDSISVDVDSFGGYSSNVIPIMTSNTAHSGEVKASAVSSSTYDAWKAFDGDDSTYWYTNDGKKDGWIQYKFSSEKRIARYRMKTQGEGTYPPNPKNWTFEGSHDGVEWNILDTRTNVNTLSKTTFSEFECKSNVPYMYYKLNVSSVHGGSLAVNTIEMMEPILGGADIKTLVCGDNGRSYNGKTEVDITDLASVKANGFTPEELNALTKEQLATLFPNGTARFAFYLEQESLTDVVEIQSLTINEKKYTISPTVSDISVIYEVLKSEQPTLFISRDDGITWKEVSQDEVESLSNLPEGNQLRVKALLADGQEVQAISYSWA